MAEGAKGHLASYQRDGLAFLALTQEERSRIDSHHGDVLRCAPASLAAPLFAADVDAGTVTEAANTVDDNTGGLSNADEMEIENRRQVRHPVYRLSYSFAQKS
jgi:hypothetical protein